MHTKTFSWSIVLRRTGLVVAAMFVTGAALAGDGSLGTVVTNDCNSNGVDDAQDISDGTSFDCTANGIPDECEPDCNLNGVADSCDLADGTSNDVGGNGVPDECEFEACELAELTASNGLRYGYFGSGVAISEDVAVIGAVGGSGEGQGVGGSAYVFRWNPDRSGWVETAELFASDGTWSDFFGQSVSVSGNTIVVGAVFADCQAGDDCGAAYVFRFNGTSWVEEARLTASDAGTADTFGYPVSISGDTILVGAGTADCGAMPNCGAAYVFRFDGTDWVEEAKLTVADVGVSDLFGSSVYIRGDTAFVGAPLQECLPLPFPEYNEFGPVCGAVYVFRFDGTNWVETETLTASDAASADRFGTSISAVGNTAVVGARFKACAAGDQCGAAYVFRFDGTNWVEEAKLTASDAAAFDSFGMSVSVGEDIVVVGAQYYNDACSNGPDCEPGSGYVFRRTGSSWVESQTLAGSDSAGSDRFGVSVSVSGNLVLVGADYHDEPDIRSGSAYLFTVGPVAGITPDVDGNGIPDQCPTDRDCNLNGQPDREDIAAGTSADCNANGVPDECEPDCNQNGVADGCDVETGTSSDCNLNDVPDECEPDCNQNGVADGCDVETGTSSDCNLNNVPDECEADCNQNGMADGCDVETGTSSDCNSNGVPDECDIAGGTSIDCNADGIPDECGLDCNANGRADECDIAQGLSEDCTLNGIPDECEPDCNFNGVADSCDVEAGASSDCNLNGIPDECEPDCNLNDVPDSCDLADGTSIDADGDGVPDECTFSACEINELTGSHAGNYDYFGAAVSISEDVAVIGAWGGSTAGPGGSTYVFRWDPNRSGWVDTARLEASDSAWVDLFGQSVSVWGETIVVGATNADCQAGDDCGAAYVFRFDGMSWVEEAKLAASDAGAGDNFGRSVSINEDLILVGSVFDECGGSPNCGAAYVFRFDGTSWVEEAKLTSSTTDSGDFFGNSVSIRGDTAFVGASAEECIPGWQGPPVCGAVYVFRFDGITWVETEKLTASDASPADGFGGSVSVSGDAVVVGARQDDCAAGSDCGAAYVFRFDGTHWVEESKLTASDARAGDWFGRSVSISGEVVVVGSMLDDDACNGTPGCDSGSGYVFRWTGASWIEDQELIGSDSRAGDRFGVSVSVSGNVVLSGADYHDDSGFRSGSAYLFTIGPVAGINPDLDGNGIPDQCDPERDCNLNGQPDSEDIATGISEDCNENGVPDECDIARGTTEDCSANGIPDECEPDCNFNGIADSCDISAGTSLDCDLNGAPDSCDLASGAATDTNGNEVPDHCEVAALTAGLSYGDKDRFVSFIVPPESAGQETAIRVTLTSLHHPPQPAADGTPDFSAMEGEIRWVNRIRDAQGVPVAECPDSVALGTTYACAALGCDPEYADWAGLIGGGELFVCGSAIVPSSEYRVSQLAASCAGNEAACSFVSVDLTLSTALWGDVDPGQLNVLDVAKQVDKVKGLAGALPEWRTMLRGQEPAPHEESTNVLDISVVVDAMKGLAYPFGISSCN